MNSTAKRIIFDDIVLEVWDTVYEPAEDSFLFAENLNVPRASSVLDVGTGCGILATVAAKTAEKVLATDVNPYALWCTAKNATRNKVKGKISLVLADLFSAFQCCAHFDVILFNAPYLPTEDDTSDWVSLAWNGGKDGRLLIDRFITAAPNHLTPRGKIMLMQSTLSDTDRTLTLFEKRGLKAQVLAFRDLPFFETLTLIEATRQ
jgi:release factor glutamine methyltransferase